MFEGLRVLLNTALGYYKLYCRVLPGTIEYYKDFLLFIFIIE